MNKLRYQKINNHKVLHKVKKQWVVLGTTTLALFTMGINAKVVHADDSNNQTSATTESLDKNQQTTDAKTATQNGDTITDNNSSVAKANLVADDSQSASSSATNVSLVATQPTNNGNLSAAGYLSKTASNQASLGFSVAGSDSATYHQVVKVNNVNGYSNPYVIQYANDGGNSPITGIQNLVQHRQTSGGSVTSSSAAIADNVKFISSLTSTSATPILVSDANISGSIASAVSVLEIGQGPLNSGSNNSYYSGDKLWWTFDPINNPNFKGSSRNLTYMVGGNTVSTTPIKVTFKDNLGNSIASDQWITADNIYPGNTFAIAVANPSGYQFDGGYSTQGGEKVVNNNGSAVISGTFDNWSAATVNLQYQKETTSSAASASAATSSTASSSVASASTAIPATGSIRYYDVSNPSVKKQIGDANITGYQGDVWKYSAQNQVDQFLSQGYQLVSNSSAIPADNLKLGVNNDYEIDFTHATKTYTANDTLPSDIKSADLTKTFTRTISFKNANDQSIATPVTQTVTFDRTATYDEVTHAMTFSDWTTSGNSQFSAVTVPTINGYTASEKQVDAKVVTVNDIYNLFEITVMYNKNSDQQVDNLYKAYTYGDTSLPSGLQSSDLTRTFFKNFQLTDDNNKVVKQITLPVSYYRTAVYENGQFKGYSLDNTKLVNADTKTDTSNDNDAEWYANGNSVSESDLTDRFGSDYSMDVTNGWHSIVLALINSKAGEGAISFSSLSSGSTSTTTSSSTSSSASSSSSSATAISSTSNSATTSSVSTTTTTSSSSTTTTTTSSTATTTSVSTSTTSVSSTVSTTTTTSSTSSSNTTESSSAVINSSSTTTSVSDSSTNTSTSTSSSATADNADTGDSGVDNTSSTYESNSDSDNSGSDVTDDHTSSNDTSTDTNSTGADDTTNISEVTDTTSYSSNVATTTNKAKLPQTGENNEVLAEIELGLISIIFAELFSGVYRRKQK